MTSSSPNAGTSPSTDAALDALPAGWPAAPGKLLELVEVLRGHGWELVFHSWLSTQLTGQRADEDNPFGVAAGRWSYGVYGYRDQVRLSARFARWQDNGRWALDTATAALRPDDAAEQQWRMPLRSWRGRPGHVAVTLGSAADVRTLASWDSDRITAWVREAG